MKCLLPIIVIFVLWGCAPISTRDVVLHETTPEMRATYRPYQEVGFCLSPTGRVYNIHYGTWMTSPVPICPKDSIVMHSHPVWAGLFADLADYALFKEYNKRYGNEYYGIMQEKWYKIYHIKE